MVLGKLDRYLQKMKLDHLITPHTSINSKWIKHLNVRPQTIKTLEEKIGSKISAIAYSNFVGYISPGKGNKRKKPMGLHQTKKLFHSKENHEQNKRTTTNWENMVFDTFDKRIISKIYKELIKLNTKKPNNSIKK